jgi:hypothetical protein
LPVSDSSSAVAGPENHGLSDVDKRLTGESLLHSVLMMSANMVTLFRIRIGYRLFLCLRSDPTEGLFRSPTMSLVSGVAYSHFHQILMRKSSSSREI